MSNSQATILLAHGSSDPNWLAPFEQLLTQIQSDLEDERVELAYMELAEPSLENQVKRLVKEGHQNIDILPLFFAAGRHLRKDVPRMLDELTDQLNQSQQKEVSITLRPPVGLSSEVAEAISKIVIRQVTQANI